MSDKLVIEKEIKGPFRLINIIDPHLADHPPGYRCDDYTSTALGKLGQIRRIASKRKVNIVTLTGDLFSDRKKIKNSHELTSSFTGALKEFKCSVASILGNHDLYYNRFDSWAEQPVSNLVKGGAFTLLDNADFVFTFKSTGKKVRIRGKSYHEKSNIEHLYEPRGDEDLLIQVTHSSVSPKGGFYGKYSEEIHSYDSLLDSSPDVFLLGHIHTPYGITELSGKHFFQHGSLMRSSTHDYNLERGISVGFLEISPDLGIITEEIPLDVAPSSEIFDLAKKEKIERSLKAREEFFEKVKKMRQDSGKKSMTFDDLLSRVEGKDIDRLKGIIDDYIEKVS